MPTDERLRMLFSDLDVLPIPPESTWLPSRSPRIDSHANAYAILRDAPASLRMTVERFFGRRELARFDDSSWQIGGGAVALPRPRARTRVPLMILLLGVVVVVALYGPALARLAGAGAPLADIHPPTLQVRLSSSALEPGSQVTGVLTIRTQSASRVQSLTVGIFPVGARRPGISEASVRIRSIMVPFAAGVPANSSAEVPFMWDGRRDDGTPAMPGDYVFTASMTSATESGNAHAAMTSFANEVVIVVH